MNLIYALTCFSVIGFLYHQYTVSKSNRARADFFMGVLERALPKLVPSLYPDENANAAEQGLPPGMTPEMMAADAAKLEEYHLRETLKGLTVQILSAHQYQISYSAAHEKAEQMVTEMYAINDRPLSERMAKVVSSEVKGESVAGVKPPKQAPQTGAVLQ